MMHGPRNFKFKNKKDTFVGIIFILFTAMLITHVQLRKGYKRPESTVDECCNIGLNLIFNDYLASVLHKRMSIRHWRNDEGGKSKYSKRPVPATICPFPPTTNSHSVPGSVTRSSKLLADDMLSESWQVCI
jgi:hypothetical protein